MWKNWTTQKKRVTSQKHANLPSLKHEDTEHLSSGRGSLVGCSPWGRKESGMAERLHFHFSLSCTGEGNGNPLQHSCLENPRDRGAWWAAIYRVAQSRTQLKWLSSNGEKQKENDTQGEIFVKKKKNGRLTLVRWDDSSGTAQIGD